MVAPLFSVEFGNRFGALFGTDYTPIGGAQFSVDGTSGKPVPDNAGEWSNFLTSFSSVLSVPQHLWKFQESSGNNLDSVGSGNLTVTNSSYQKVIAGWSRFAMGGPGTAVTGTLRNLAMANTATTSYLIFAFGRFDTPTASLGAFVSYGSPTVQLPAITNKVRLREGGNLLDSTNNHNSTVHPFLLSYNISNSTVKLYTDLEKISITFTTSVGTSLSFATANTGDTGSRDFLYAASWEGAAAEVITDAEAKKLITAFGFSPPWS